MVVFFIKNYNETTNKMESKNQKKTMKKPIHIVLKLLVLLTIFTSCSSDDDNPESNTVAIPDTNFERALIDANIDTNGLNGNILKTDAEAVNYLDVSGKDIYSLQGIEAFINITILFCINNELTTLDVSNNPNLEEILCANNRLTSFDVSANPSVTILALDGNRLERLNIKNLNNIDPFYLNTLGNPNLNCIEVDDVNYSFNNWDFDVDSQVSFNVNCN